MSQSDSREKKGLPLQSVEFLEIRALCDEMMESLCQVRALLEPINDTDFFHRLGPDVLRHYFYAVDSIIVAALSTNDGIMRLIDAWESA